MFYNKYSGFYKEFSIPGDVVKVGDSITVDSRGVFGGSTATKSMTVGLPGNPPAITWTVPRAATWEKFISNILLPDMMGQPGIFIGLGRCWIM